VSHAAPALPEAGARRAARLGPYRYACAPSEPLNAPLRREYLAALARHQDIKRELVPLIAAWRAAGIEALLYKGFFLSEFVYPAPGARFHGDVDLLIRPEHGPQALRIALELGWERRWSLRRVGAPDGGHLFDLYRPRGAAQLDVQHLLVKAARWWKHRQRRITEAVWAQSNLLEWEGTAVRVPDPMDAVIVNLALERAVNDAARGLKPQDAIDLALLLERGSVTREELNRRARELGCSRTLSLFLQRCRPALAPGVPRRPSRLGSLRWKVAGTWEGGFVHVPLALLRVARAPGLAWDIAKALPLLVRVRRALRRHRDVRDVLASVTPAAPASVRSTARARWRAFRAIYWACKLLPIGPREGNCLLRALAIYAALRRQGWAVEFVSGVRRAPPGLQGHAWVEEDGAVLSEMSGWEWTPHYQGNFRYPPRA
jgi:hypothetical protein